MSKKSSVKLEDLDVLYTMIDPETWEECGETDAPTLMEAWGCKNLQQIEKNLDKGVRYDGCIIIEDFDDGYFQELEKRKANRERSCIFTEDSSFCYYVTTRKRVFSVTKDGSRIKKFIDTFEEDGEHSVFINNNLWNVENLISECFSLSRRKA